MIIARLTSEGVEDRFVPLTPGQHVFGSDLSADVVLLDPGMPPEAFVVNVGTTGVTVGTVADGGRRDRLGGERIDLAVGQSFVWSAGDIFSFGPVSITLRGEDLVAPQDRVAIAQAEQRRREGIATKVRAVLAGLAATATLLVALSWYPAPASTISQSVQSANLIGANRTVAAGTAAINSASQPPADTLGDELKSRFAQAGLELSNLERRGDQWFATVYIDGAPAQGVLDALTPSLPAGVVVKPITDAHLLTAARMDLDNMGYRDATIAIERGRITLGGVPEDAELRRQLDQNLHADVPDLREVKFVGIVPQAAEDILPTVAAVWSGTRPYVLLQDGKMVRRGEKLTDRLELVMIRAGELVLRDPARPELGETVVRIAN